MNRDDEIGRALRDFAASVEADVRRPPVREVLRRAGRNPHPVTVNEAKPFPWAGIIGVAAIPFVAIGAVLVGPAGAGILGSGDDARPLPTAGATSDAAEVSALEVPVEPAIPSAAPVPSDTATGGSALSPLTRVTVVLTDERLPDQGCRRLVTADRFVDDGNQVGATIDELLAGPRPEEAAVGLSSPVDGGAAAVTVDPQALVVVVDVADPSAWRDGCGPEEFQRALARTVDQFDGWQWQVSVGGVPLERPADLVAEAEGVPDGDPSSVPSVEASVEPSVITS